MKPIVGKLEGKIFFISIGPTFTVWCGTIANHCCVQWHACTLYNTNVTGIKVRDALNVKCTLKTFLRVIVLNTDWNGPFQESLISYPLA